MRICHLGKFYHPVKGGIETHVRVLAHAQAALGLEVQVVCMRQRSEGDREERDGPVRVRRLIRRASVAKLDWLPELPSALSELNYDILHVHVPNPSMILGVLSSRVSQPVVVTYHSDHVKQLIRRWLFGPLERRFYGLVSVVAATNPVMAASSRVLSALPQKVRTVPLGIDLAPLADPSREERRCIEAVRTQYEEPLWLLCGRIIYYKGHPVALRALRDVPGTLLIVGDGRQRSKMQRLARRLGVADRVVFLGNIKNADLRALYHTATALWFPSLYPSEAFGLVQVEAMACGCPVINTDIPGSGVSWVSRHEETGLTVPVGDAAALARAARRLIEESGLRERLSHGARRRALEEFDHRLMAERWQQIYQDVAARVARPSGNVCSAPLG